MLICISVLYDLCGIFPVSVVFKIVSASFFEMNKAGVLVSIISLYILLLTAAFLLGKLSEMISTPAALFCMAKLIFLYIWRGDFSSSGDVIIITHFSFVFKLY